MAEFTEADRVREERRHNKIRGRIENALGDMKSYRKCFHCKKSFQIIQSMGKRQCSLHPFSPHTSSTEYTGTSDPTYWRGHHACCGRSGTDQPCVVEMAGLLERHEVGCTRCDHSEEVFVPFRPNFSVDVLPVHFMEDQFHNGRQLVCAEPLFILSAIARERGHSLDTRAGRRAIFGGDQYVIVDSPDRIDKMKNERVQLEAASFSLSISLRQAYTHIVSTYNLPDAIFKKNFVDSERRQRSLSSTSSSYGTREASSSRVNSLMGMVSKALGGGGDGDDHASRNQDTHDLMEVIPEEGEEEEEEEEEEESSKDRRENALSLDGRRRFHAHRLSSNSSTRTPPRFSSTSPTAMVMSSDGLPSDVANSRNRGLQDDLDEYYDADKLLHSFSSTGGSPNHVTHGGRVTRSDNSNNIDVISWAKSLTEQVASSQEADTFYPFAIWSWVD